VQRADGGGAYTARSAGQEYDNRAQVDRGHLRSSVALQ
jgi:hypothetical protein